MWQGEAVNGTCKKGGDRDEMQTLYLAPAALGAALLESSSANGMVRPCSCPTINQAISKGTFRRRI